VTNTPVPTATHRIPWPTTVRPFLILFLPLALLVLGGAGFLITAEQRRQEANLLANELLQVRLGQGVLAYRVHQVARDVRFLSRLHTLADALEDPDTPTLARLAEDFQAFSEAKASYDQVRWLDETGQERMRVDYQAGQGQVIPAGALQNKALRYYFRDTLALDRGQVFLSPLDLNVEHGRIEIPYRPMLRIGTPVFDRQGRKRGVVLLNYYGAQLLGRFREVTEGAAHHIMLLNRDGDWLAAPNPADEWGFMLGNKDSFARRHPQAWRRIQTQDSGQFRAADGLWSFASVYPLETGETSSTGAVAPAAASTGSLDPGQYVWKVVAHLPLGRLAVGGEFLGQILAASGLILLLLGLGTFRLARARLREQHAAEALRGLNGRLQDEVAVRAQAEQAARQSEVYLATLVRTAPDAIMVIDTRGRVELCNPEMERLFGYSAEELIGHNINLLMPSPEREAHDGYLRHYLETGERRVIGIGREVSGLHKDGHRLPLYLKVGEMGQGEHRRFVGFLHDIRNQKKIQAEREHYLAELERSNQELDEFAYVASHDLKEPLRGIHNYANFLIEDYTERLPEDGQDKLRTLIRLATRMEQLINDLLYFSRVGRWELDLGPVDMDAALDAAREALEARLAETGGRIECPRPLPPAWSDRVRIPEVFQNLVSNALKYNDNADKRVEVGWLDAPEQTSHPIPPGQQIYYVRDNGIGIRPKHLDSVFQIFKRLHARDQYGGGSGAGLTITRKLLHRLGGEIWVESVYGEGSTFYFSLPMGPEIPDLGQR